MSHAAEAGPTIQHHLDEPIPRHMRPDTSRININQTVGEALAAIRNHPPEGRVIYFYVVDDDNRLHGVVPTRRLLLSPLDRDVSDIMVREVITINQQATVLEACEFSLCTGSCLFPWWTRTAAASASSTRT